MDFNIINECLNYFLVISDILLCEVYVVKFVIFDKSLKVTIFFLNFLLKVLFLIKGNEVDVQLVYFLLEKV